MIGRGAWIRRDARRNALIVVRDCTVDFETLGSLLKGFWEWGLTGLEMPQSIYLLSN
jgi:hypothetical protein